MLTITVAFWDSSYSLVPHIAAFAYKGTLKQIKEGEEIFAVDHADIDYNIPFTHFSGNLLDREKESKREKGNFNAKKHIQSKIELASKINSFNISKTFDDLNQWWQDYPKKEYSLFTNNCAHRVRDFLVYGLELKIKSLPKTFTWILGFFPIYIPSEIMLTPRSVYSAIRTGNIVKIHHKKKTLNDKNAKKITESMENILSSSVCFFKNNNPPRKNKYKGCNNGIELKPMPNINPPSFPKKSFL